MASSRSRSNGAWVVIFLVLAGAAAVAVAGASPAAGPAVRPLPQGNELPAFALVDQQGRPFGREQLKGSVWIADLMFTRCAGQCPRMHERMQTLAGSIADSNLRLASFSVDPANDTPEVLAAYAKRWRAPAVASGSGDAWVFLTGAPGEVDRLAKDGFSLAAAGEGEAAGPALHSMRLVLIDAEGRVRGTYASDEAVEMERLQADASRLLSALESAGSP